MTGVFARDLLSAAVGASLREVGSAVPAAFSEVSTDTRRLRTGALFVALAGERYDGHAFVQQALRAGAAAALVERARIPAGTERDRLIVVEDSLRALQDFATGHLAALPARRVALTGSNGKTTTKELCAAAMSACLEDDRVLATQGNLNNHIGVPLTAFRVTPAQRVAIFEMGMNHLGEIARLVDIVRPEAGLITNIGTAHAANVGGIEGVARAKGELFAGLPHDAIAVVNADDPRCVAQAALHPALRTLRFGRGADVDLRLVLAEPLPAGSLRCVFSWRDEEAEVVIPLEGEHNAQNAAAALALAMTLDMDFARASAGLARVRGIGGRLTRRLASCGATLLDDTYNANPDSMRAGLATLVQVAGQRRRLAVLGEMREVERAAQAHREIGAWAAQLGVDLVAACGEAGRAYLEGARAAGMSPGALCWAADSVALGEVLQTLLTADDVVFVKGSRAARMELVVQALVGEGPGTDAEQGNT